MAVQTLHMINNDAGPQTIKTRVGDVFTLGAFIFPKTGNTGGGTVKLNLHCTSTVASPPAPVDVVAFSETIPATGSWTYIQGNATIPAGYDTVDPQLTLTTVPVSDTIYIDDLLCRETTAEQNLADSIYQALTGTGGANNSWASIGTQLASWISNLYSGSTFASTIKTAAVPGLDGSKIISGSISQSFLNITSIAASLVSGALTALNIPALDATKITTGIFGTTQIPNITKAMSTDLQTFITTFFGSSALGTTQAVSSLPPAIPSVNVPALLGLTTAANMVLAPDFESTTLWAGAVGSQSALQAHSGTKSWAVLGAG